MPATTENPPLARLPTREVLLQKRRGWFLGLTGDQLVKYVFQGNAAVSIIVLALITFTIFKDAVGFIPLNHDNLVLYRQAGLEYVDHYREQVTAHSAISRYLADLRQRQLDLLMKREGLAPAEAMQRLAEFDTFANAFADTIAEHETLLGTMTDHVTAVKERQTVAEDLAVAKQNFLDAMAGATPARAAELQRRPTPSRLSRSISRRRSSRCWRCGPRLPPPMSGRWPRSRIWRRRRQNSRTRNSTGAWRNSRNSCAGISRR